MDTNNRKMKNHTGLARARAYLSQGSLLPKAVDELTLRCMSAKLSNIQKLQKLQIKMSPISALAFVLLALQHSHIALEVTYIPTNNIDINNIQ